MASKVSWPAVPLRSSASPVLTSMFSSALKSAATFTVTSQHAVCLHWDQAVVCCANMPLGLADHALSQKERLKSLQIFHARMHSVLPCNTECVSAHLSFVWSSHSCVSEQLVACSEGRGWELLDEDWANNYAPRQRGCMSERPPI